MRELTVPDAAIRYVLYQRAYFRLPVNPLYRHVFRRLPFTVPIFSLAVAIESRLFPAHIRELYRRDMEQEYQTLLPALPPGCSAILDIGCGVAGIDVLLDRHYAGQLPALYLLDKSQVERSVYYLFHKKRAFYNSLDVARDLLTSNTIPRERIHLLSANEAHDIPINRPIDLVISLLSWGFHYPVETYAERVFALLSDGGVVILDVRKGTGGLETLRQLFGTVEVMVDAPKYRRVAVRK